MAAMMTFRVNVFQENVAVLPELQNKVRDLRPLFEQIIGEWARGNADKFGLGAGASASGMQIDPQVHWEALSPNYFKAKTQQGYPDRLMVMTGSLMASLTNPNQFFQMVEPAQAVFGTPNDPDDVMKLQYNWITRQTIFLADSDQNMIRELTQKYFMVQMQSVKQDVARMDADFANAAAFDADL